MTTLPNTTHPSQAAPETPYVLSRIEDHVAVLTLNRPQQMNVLSRALLTELQQHLRTLAEDRSVRVIVLASQGKAFSAGHDLKELANQPAHAVDDLFDLCTEVMEGVRLNAKPVIAQVQGVAAAAGCQLVASCDLAVTADTVRFGTTGIKSGLFCSTPMVPLSRVVPTKKALEMLLTGNLISAQEAEQAGLVNRVVPAERLETETMTLAKQIAANSPYAVRLGKQAFYQQLPLGVEDAYAVGKQAIVTNTLDPQGQEGITAFLEKRPAHYQD